jgi:type I restriction enzyme S subunit
MKVGFVGDVSEQVRGVSYSKSESSEEARPGFVAILRANNITDEGLTFDDLVYVPVARVSAKQRIHANDVVVAASSGSLSVVGKAAQARQIVDGSFGAFCKVLRPNAKVDPLYFGHFFRTPVYRRTVSGLAAGANINNLKNEHLDNLQIPLPPLPEQKRIAAILDAADALRAKRRESIEQLDSLIQATFLEMFGDPATHLNRWQMKTCDDICTKVTDGEHGTVDRLPSGCLYLMARNVTTCGEIDLGEVSFISEADHRRIFQRCDPAKGDILLVCVGATIGKTAIVPDMPEFSLARSVALLKPRRNLVQPAYLNQYLRSRHGQKQLLHSRNTAAQSGLYLGKIKAMSIPLPPLDLQSRFASIVGSIEQQKARLKAHLAELDVLFTSLQSRAFNGELVA